MKKAILPVEQVIGLSTSSFLWGWWLFFSMLNMACACYAMTWPWAAAYVVFYAAMSCWHYTQLAGVAWPDSVHVLRLDVYGQLWLHQYNAVIRPASVLPDSVVYPQLLCLHLRLLPDEGTEQSVQTSTNQLHPTTVTRWLLILPDMLSKEDLRALRVWLRWGNASDSSGSTQHT